MKRNASLSKCEFTHKSRNDVVSSARAIVIKMDQLFKIHLDASSHFPRNFCRANYSWNKKNTFPISTFFHHLKYQYTWKFLNIYLKIWILSLYSVRYVEINGIISRLTRFWINEVYWQKPYLKRWSCSSRSRGTRQ